MTPQIDLNGIEAFLAGFEAWCGSINRAPSTVTGRALGNTYAIDAIRRRHARLINDLETLSGVMSNSPFQTPRTRKRAPRQAAT